MWSYNAFANPGRGLGSFFRLAYNSSDTSDTVSGFGWSMQAIVSLYCEGTMAAAEVREAVEVHPEVVAAYTVAGEASAVLVVRASDTGHLEKLLERVREHKGVLRTRTQIVLSTLFERPLHLDAPTP